MDGLQDGRRDHYTDTLATPSKYKPDNSDILMHTNTSIPSSQSAITPSSSCSSQQHRNEAETENGQSDFSPYFLVAAAAASAQAQAQAARAAEILPPTTTSSSSSSASTNINANTSQRRLTPPPLPYMEERTPFPMSLGSHRANVDTKSESHRSNHGTDGLGKMRCSWAILSTTTKQLKFMYADPTFSRHLSSQANALIGTSFFDYIHPEERERAELDMQNIIQSKTLFGSVTRCRYSRTHRIRSLLGATDPPVPSNCSKLNAEDKDYLAIDIVVNWIGDGMALCFFHAIMDESVQDNDEVERTDWSNWCGMQENAFDQEECQIIWQRIKSNRSLTRSPTGPNYVFQILSSVSSQDISPNVLFSWPPPRLSSVPSTLTDTSTTTSNTNFADGSYCIDDFARLAQGVNLLTLKRELSDANTSCTRRFRAKHTLTTEVMVRSVESVLIPYGSIVLACFSVPYAQILPGSADAPFSSSSKTVEYPKPEGIPSAHVDKKAELSNPSLASLVDASISMAKKEAGGNGSGDQQRSTAEVSGSGSGSVATLAAVAAAAAAQSKQCASCGTSNSPEWRKGPDGSKSLCNACGLRFARNISRAKKREERALMAAEVAANGGIIPPHLRKKLGDLKKPKKKQNKEKQASTSTSSSTATLPPFPLNPAQHSTNEDDASIQLARAAARAAAAAGLRQS